MTPNDGPNEGPNENSHMPKAIMNALFGGPPPSAEDRVAIQKSRQAEARAAIPLAEDILLKCRELEAMVHNHQKLGTVRATLACLIEEMRFDADYLDPDCSR